MANKTKLEAMIEIQALTVESIVYSEIELENGKRTCEALKVQRESISKIGGEKKGKAKYEFEKKVLAPFDEELNRNLFGAIKKEQILNSSRVSLAILEDMIAEAQSVPVPAGVPDVEHTITQEALDNNPGMEKDVKIGDEVLIPNMASGATDEALGNGGVPETH